MNTESSRRIELLVAGLASFVSLLALGVSAYATYWQRQQARAQVWPRLQWVSYSAETYAYFELENVGTGPAEVRAVEVTYEGQPIHRWEELRARVSGNSAPVKGQFSTASLHGRVLGAGASIKPLGGRDAEGISVMKQIIPRLAIRICYCSILEECWSLRSAPQEDSVVPVASCRGEPNSYEH